MSASFLRLAPLIRFIPAIIALLAAAILLTAAPTARAAEPVKISRDDTALDLTRTTDIYVNQGEAFQVSTAAGSDGIRRRIEVRASSPGHQGDWAVFALSNVSEEQLERVIVAPHFRLANSKMFWPDLGSQRIISITPSEGFALDRIPSPDADVFRITLNPGSTITFVAELATPSLPQIYLWQPDAYKDTVNSFTLYRGIVLGIAGLLAVFLTILFVVKGTSMLPAAAALAWAVLAYICVDFGFLDKLITVTSGDQRIWRAAAEVALASSLVIFLFTYLNLNRWHVHLGYATLAWVVGLVLLGGVAIYDPSVAAGIARLSFALTGTVGILLIIYLGFNRYDRAILLVPTWALILVWLFGGWLTVTGKLDNDIIQPALGGGLVLIVLLIGFTVMQHAFAGGAYQQGLFSDLERQSLALTGSGDTVWDWDVARDRVVTTPDISTRLGLDSGAMHGPVRNWVPRLHPDDRDRFRATLDVLLEHRRGRLNHEFRIRAEDGHFHWLQIRARPVLGSNGEIIRCVGTIIDVTEQKNSVERLLQDAMHDNLTGLPNRQVFLDRLQSVLTLAPGGDTVRPTVMAIDIDRYKQVNDSLGIAAGDNILIALTRRLRRLLKPQDTLARLAGDQFGLILVSERDPAKVADFADAVSKAIMVPINFANREIILTASIGLSSWVDQQESASGMLADAELAMYRAKRAGGNRVEPFRPAFRAAGADKLQIETDLRRAIERKELFLAYQPIIRLKDGEIAGFEALMRWDHPKRGSIPPSEFIPIAEMSDLIGPLGLFAIDRAASDLMVWQQQTGNLPVFVSVNLSSAQLLNADLYNDVRALLQKTQVNPGQLKLELTESLMMENPEQARLVLGKLKETGLSLALDDFGTGYSSLAYLTQFPFDTIKLDKALVRNATEKRAVLLRSVIAMARALEMTVVAEGVETDEDAAELAKMGCHFGQSYLFGPPAPADAVLRLLKERFPLTKRA
ncbi:EAL domain-containing protein [Neorhizobium galegae]|uniref:Diguanylate cyclase/phosphodiesterase with PAS/PAC and periplasmic/7TM domain sensor(S) n=1 Tax=Neorhizobium galegae bv. orientalis str. HAMBI 540 TaxID=1028800 RepID=A0A068SM11_NEOGA|nr:EAL domain-containing protein [Neorhizobium galegae]MCQ1849798.1 EAL domain-containing protein [Neorhizobium galegae]CDN46781.1 Diguanylate cyclase/phosphodiesterase with PAS/PAC and periplasmic/7TM domain sensor(S) [Neorhizobium galegae bv. orientalis str. HAMBI 540]CDZ53415.1 Diguanylate cyclase/phosphodiesterase with PAS/PAC and periplasmic/7TM domain sensor(S) [Neorhizobium galegae bv. orientalis]